MGLCWCEACSTLREEERAAAKDELCWAVVFVGDSEGEERCMNRLPCAVHSASRPTPGQTQREGA